LQAYGELAENKPEYIASYLKVLGQLELQQPENSLVQAALGRRDLKNGDFKSAVDHLRRAMDSHPPVATTYSDLADALSHIGQTAEVLPLIEKAIELDPYNPVPRKMLVVQLIAAKEFKRAHDALQQYIEFFPQDEFMRKMLERADGKSVR
jgi:Flp pilus assembly protein TadD